MTELGRAPHTCGNPDCGNVIVKTADRGRMPTYCSVKCRSIVSCHRNAAARAGHPWPPQAVTTDTTTRAGQLRAYFDLLIGLAEKAEDKQQRDSLFDRIEQTLTAFEAETAPAGPDGRPSGRNGTESRFSTVHTGFSRLPRPGC